MKEAVTTAATNTDWSICSCCCYQAYCYHWAITCYVRKRCAVSCTVLVASSNSWCCFSHAMRQCKRQFLSVAECSVIFLLCLYLFIQYVFPNFVMYEYEANSFFLTAEFGIFWGTNKSFVFNNIMNGQDYRLTVNYFSSLSWYIWINLWDNSTLFQILKGVGFWEWLYEHICSRGESKGWNVRVSICIVMYRKIYHWTC
jgi:hypothetical protein